MQLVGNNILLHSHWLTVVSKS